MGEKGEFTMGKSFVNERDMNCQDSRLAGVESGRLGYVVDNVTGSYIIRGIFTDGYPPDSYSLTYLIVT